ncbi:MAG: hypothetical protein HRU72_14175 [Planctomycetia bacterium]|nr:MAG: hypothetical protein HRU72_14175 [Planctomycetia bacterium]
MINKKCGPCNAYFLWFIANRWKEAPEAHCRIYPPILKIPKPDFFVKLI